MRHQNYKSKHTKIEEISNIQETLTQKAKNSLLKLEEDFIELKGTEL